eukprot:CAMPEP_0119058546 /NCGR_PEP_ID=MMETSP1178-20130426/2830_1 /TAXON_ID=33656 /ORGANISM="unid sp, Strain CCMP2000" /LENGTH=242 /DNA_ID=CAMNT_0007039489 /DNA_START=162 /DNA_END=890 /DNA_ORIENTATION=+
MTGNLVFIGRSLLFFFVDCPKTDADSARGLCVKTTEEEVVYRFMVIVSHLLGVFAMVALERQVPPSRAVPLAAPGLALLILLADLLPAVLWYSGAGAASTSIAKQWSVCLVALALGATHYVASPVSNETFLAAPAFAATGAMHKTVKTLARLLFSPAEVGEHERRKTCQVFCTVITMFTGALLGTSCLFLNPFARDYDFDGDDDTWLFVPVAITLYAVLCVHGRASAPAGGWPKTLIEPLVP